MRNQILSVCMAALMLTGMALAQTAEAPASAGQGKHARGEGRMFAGLNLTPDQKAKVQTIFQSERSQMQALRSNTSLTEEQKKQQVRELRKNNHQQLMAVLTPEQQAQLKQHHPGAGKGGFRARGFQALNLTAEQKTQLQPIFQSTRQQMQALRADTSLTPEQKHEKMQQIRQNQMTQMKSILTPEQQQQMQQMRGRHSHRGGEKPNSPSGL
jgi:Spy/CpxP family protein refolding chaperone